MILRRETLPTTTVNTTVNATVVIGTISRRKIIVKEMCILCTQVVFFIFFLWKLFPRIDQLVMHSIFGRAKVLRGICRYNWHAFKGVTCKTSFYSSCQKEVLNQMFKITITHACICHMNTIAMSNWQLSCTACGTTAIAAYSYRTIILQFHLPHILDWPCRYTARGKILIISLDWRPWLHMHGS